ncbi:MAG: reverse transcriptase domain-containing protein [Candidatus Ozemobacteraceae bacterium]
MSVDFLREAYARTRKSSAPGVDRVTADEYALNLEANLTDLHDRLRNGKYRAPPVKRVWIEKEDGKQRPIGMPTFEDKVVQRAVHMLMSTVYEKDFHEFSYGFREGISQHKAIHDLREKCIHLRAKWIIDADISGFFDNIDHTKLVDFIRLRINDGNIIRLIGKWLNAGVLEEGLTSYPEKGTPQGGVMTP